MAHMKESILINAPVQKVNEIVEDPRRWSSYMVGMEKPTKFFGDTGIGAGAEYRMAIMPGIRARATTTVTEERHDPDGSTLWRWDQKGSTCAWWTCHHQVQEGKTFAVSELDYTPPAGALGRFLDRLFIAGFQKRNMHRTLENVKRLAEGS
jgi:hypothetical protein